MRYPERSGGRRSGIRGARSLALAALGLLALSGMVEPAPARAEALQQEEAADTTRSPLRFRKTVVPSTEYLSQVLDAAAARREKAELTAVHEIEIDIDLPADARAGELAQRYGVSRELAQQIVAVALAEGIDPDLAFRLIRVESRFKTRARGPMGALGLTQLMPGTARSIDRSVRTEDQILHPGTNLRLGFRYLRGMIEKYDGDVRLGLLAYNRGPVAVDRALRSGRDPENGYSHKVLGTRGKNPYRGKGLLTR